MNIKTILWPTDLSDNSLKALPKVVAMSGKFESRVILLYVATDMKSFFPAYGGPTEPKVVEEFANWEQEKARERMDDICKNKLDVCPLVDTRIATGDPVSEILRTVTEESVDMIIMTTHGHGHGRPSEQPLHGSVADRVSKASSVPVLLVNPSGT